MSATASPSRFILEVDPTCVACLICPAIEPEAFDLAGSRVLPRHGTERLWPRLWTEIQEAARLCPTDAIRTGEVADAA